MRSVPSPALVLILMLIGPVAALGAQPPDDADKVTAGDVEQQARELGKVLQGYTAEQRRAAQRKARQALDDLDAQVDRLEARIREHWSTMSEAARRDAQGKLDELNARRARAAEWYRELQASSAAAWEHVKEGFSESYAALEKAWRDAAREFESEH